MARGTTLTNGLVSYYPFDGSADDLRSANPVTASNALTFGTGKTDQAKLVEFVRENFQMTPRGIMESLRLRRPIFKKTAAYGHFGRTEPEFTWERTDKAHALADEAKGAVRAA